MLRLVRARLFGVIVATALTTVACASSNGSGSSDAAPPTTGPAATTLAHTAPSTTIADAATSTSAPEPADPAPVVVAELTDVFPTLDEATIDLATLRGEDVVLWFWAPW